MDPSWEAQGEALAQARRAALADVIVNDPAMALRWAVPMAKRRHLPPRITRLLEERVEGLADIEVIAVLGLPESLSQPSIQRWVILPGRIYRAHVHGWRLLQGSTNQVPILGVALDDQLAVASHPWELDGDAPSPAADGPTDAGNPPPLAAATDNPVLSIPRIQRILFLRVVFADALEPSISEAAAHAMLALADAFYRTNSYGLLGLAGTVTPPLLLPRTRSWYAISQDCRTLREDALQAATAMGFPPTDFDLDVVHHPEIFLNSRARATVGSRGIWMQTSQPQALVHELGHNLGLWHANSWATTDGSVAGVGVNREYGDVYDTMGNGYPDLHAFNVYQKHRLGWLPPSAIHTVIAEGTYQLQAFDTDAIDDGPIYALRILTGEKREYWLETRRSLNRNPALGASLLVRWSPWGRSNGGTQLLDTSPGSQGGPFDAPLPIGRCFHDPFRGYKITPSLPANGLPHTVEVTVRSVFYQPAMQKVDPAVLAAPVPGGGLVAAANRNHPASYRIHLPADGSYALWCRLAYRILNPMVALTMDGQPPQCYAVLPSPEVDGWHWALIQPSACPPGAPLLELTAGSHQFAIEPLHENVEIDQLLLTNDPTTNAPPMIAPVPDYTVLGWTAPLAIPFEVLDLDSPPATLRVSVESIDSAQMTPAELRLEGQGLHRVLHVVPRAGTYGQMTLRLTVADLDGNASCTRLQVTALRPPTDTGSGDPVLPPRQSWPTSGTPAHLGIHQDAAGRVTLVLTGQPGHRHALQCTTNLVSWETLALVPLRSFHHVFCDYRQPQPNRIYRALLIETP
jgi:hypothetical protein